jgi:hypothetical protein
VEPDSRWLDRPVPALVRARLSNRRRRDRRGRLDRLRRLDRVVSYCRAARGAPSRS